MKFLTPFIATLSLLAVPTFGRIWDNDQLRPDTTIDTKLAVSLLDTKEAAKGGWKTYKPDAKELSYKGRWDSRHTSWWSAPGLKFGFTGEKVAISFGKYTSPGVLIAFRYAGQDWQFTNVTAGQTHELISSRPLTSDPSKTPTSFELRVTNWAYGVQIAGVHIPRSERLYRIPDFPKRLEVIGDSLSAGMYASYESLSSWAYLTAAGFGNVEYSISAYPGICVTDQECWGNPRGQVHQWAYTSDGNVRQNETWGNKPEKWNFKKQQPADIVIINLGTNDNNTANGVKNEDYVRSYKQLIDNVHSVFPRAQIIAMGLWNGFGPSGETYTPSPAFVKEIPEIVQSANRKYRKEFVHYFDVTGILQHNDIGPGTWHPTDIGQMKVAAQMQMFIKMKFGWKSESVGPMVHSGTYIYNDECCY
ncbi:SGNH hydrolase [Ascobolus immersus RN42]|uniref:SGNH hydrolase n=1 Tax=Ascobolus immersus RN42 TaxID=1160509 RepID=A0A3N4IHP7_ASCIM|nr:SGNH hydrolase [Ascobolus immersus RN42]